MGGSYGVIGGCYGVGGVLWDDGGGSYGVIGGCYGVGGGPMGRWVGGSMGSYGMERRGSMGVL